MLESSIPHTTRSMIAMMAKAKTRTTRAVDAKRLIMDGFLPEIRLQFYGGEGPTGAL